LSFYHNVQVLLPYLYHIGMNFYFPYRYHENIFAIFEFIALENDYIHYNKYSCRVQINAF
jgi:hypothetical protein